MAGILEIKIPFPSGHFNDAQVRSGFVFRVEILRQFPDSHSVADRQGHVSDKGPLVGIEHRPFHFYPTDRIGPIQNIERNLRPGSFLHTVGKGRHISVKASADILNIKDQDLNPFQHLRSGPLGLTIEAVNRKARLLVH